VSLRLASIPFVVERLGQPFMKAGTKVALRATGDVRSRAEVAQLSAMNARRGTARAFARTVRDVIDWRGQRRTFFERARELFALPPIAVFWGDHDTVIPFSHAEALAKRVDRVHVTRFEGCGHYPHHEKPDAFADSLREFLDVPDARAAASISR
jgi:pimeloyl-ACP methyl ester carboxylesterase